MDYLDLLREIFEMCIVPLLGVLTAYLVKYINKKSAELEAETHNELVKKYINMLDKTITEAVMATTQTYVEYMKDNDIFDDAAQKAAFAKTYEVVSVQLTSEARVYLKSVYEDVDKYIATKIEAEVLAQK